MTAFQVLGSGSSRTLLTGCFHLRREVKLSHPILSNAEKQKPLMISSTFAPDSGSVWTRLIIFVWIQLETKIPLVTDAALSRLGWIMSDYKWMWKKHLQRSCKDALALAKCLETVTVKANKSHGYATPSRGGKAVERCLALLHSPVSYSINQKEQQLNRQHPLGSWVGWGKN